MQQIVQYGLMNIFWESSLGRWSITLAMLVIVLWPTRCFASKATTFQPTNALSNFDGLFISTSGLRKSNLMSLEILPYAEFIGRPLDCSIDACVALTFDDGPDPIITPQIVDTLNRYGARATFFVVGVRVQPSASLLLQMHVGGHEIENHSWAHPDFRRLRPVQVREQIDLTQQAVGNAGVPKPRFFRPPYEFRSDSMRHTVAMPFILWNVDVKDWAQKNSDKLAGDIIESVKPGSIVVLHDTKEITLKALPKVLDSLHGQYRFVTVRQLLQLPDDARGEFYGR